jgi:hypothetical protein
VHAKLTLRVNQPAGLLMHRITPNRRGAALETFRPWTEKGHIATPAETRERLRLPVRVEQPRDVLNPTVLSVRLVPGRRILSNAIPANGLSAPTANRPEYAECNAPPNWVVLTFIIYKLRMVSLTYPRFFGRRFRNQSGTVL